MKEMLSLFTSAFEAKYSAQIARVKRLSDVSIWMPNKTNCMISCGACGSETKSGCLGNLESENLLVVKSEDSFPVKGSRKSAMFWKVMKRFRLREDQIMLAPMYQCGLRLFGYKPVDPVCLVWLREVVLRMKNLKTIYLLGSDPCSALLESRGLDIHKSGNVYRTLLPDGKSVKIYALPSYLYMVRDEYAK